MQVKRIPSKTLLLFLMLVFTSIYASEVNSEVILTAAHRWIAANAIFKAELPVVEPVEAIRMTNADGGQLPLWHIPL